jgi:hypothetical protein
VLFSFAAALFFLWPLISLKWETALTKYRISTDFQQASVREMGVQDNIVLMPKDIVLTKDCRWRGPETARAPNAPGRLKRRRMNTFAWAGTRPSVGTAFGRILVPMYSDGYSYGIMAISDDRGIPGASQPIVGEAAFSSVVRKQDGTLVAYLRDNGPPPKRAHISFSKDDGVTWTRARDTDIPNPGTSLENVRLRNGTDHGVQRSRAVALLTRGGNQRRRGRYLEMERHLDGKPIMQRRFSIIPVGNSGARRSYPRDLQLLPPEGKAIKHVRFLRAWVKAGDQFCGAGCQPAAGRNPHYSRVTLRFLFLNRSLTPVFFVILSSSARIRLSDRRRIRPAIEVPPDRTAGVDEDHVRNHQILSVLSFHSRYFFTRFGSVTGGEGRFVALRNIGG